jgi:acyl carrier protein
MADMEQSVSSDDILRSIQTAMKELFDLDAARVQPGARLVEDLGLDSVDALDLVAKMEESTGQGFDDISLRKLRTVQDVIAAIHVVAARSRRVDQVPA